MVDLGISIINYKTKDLTSKCLESILNKKFKISFSLSVIDNASCDDSLDYLKKKFLKVNFIESSKNLGFAGGHNLNLKKINARYILILNSDTEIIDQTLDKMIEFMDQNKDCGISSCKVLGFDGKLQPNGGDLPFGISLIGWLFNLESIGIKSPAFHRTEADYYKKIQEVGWVSGNFMLVRAEVFKKIGNLDEDYFMYFEDVEFCSRAKNNGFKVMINPEVSIKHLSGGSLDDPHLRQWIGEYSGLIIFYRNIGGIFSEVFVRVLILISTIFRILAFTLLGKFNFAKTYAKVIISI